MSENSASHHGAPVGCGAIAQPLVATCGAGLMSAGAAAATH